MVKVEEYPAWSFRYGFQLEGERQCRARQSSRARASVGVVSEIRTPNLFGRALTGGVFGMYQRDQQDASVFVATSRLFGWSARSTLYSFFERDRLRDDAGDITTITDQHGVQRRSTLAHRVASKSSMAIASSAITPSIPAPSTIFVPLDIVADLAKLSSAVLFDRRDDPINARKGTFSSFSFDYAATRLGSDVSNRKLLAQQFVFVPAGPPGAGVESAGGVCVRRGSAAVCRSLPGRRRHQRARLR